MNYEENKKKQQLYHIIVLTFINIFKKKTPSNNFIERKVQIKLSKKKLNFALF